MNGVAANYLGLFILGLFIIIIIIIIIIICSQQIRFPLYHSIEWVNPEPTKKDERQVKPPVYMGIPILWDPYSGKTASS